jgi:hypothetical protein
MQSNVIPQNAICDPIDIDIDIDMESTIGGGAKFLASKRA